MRIRSALFSLLPSLWIAVLPLASCGRKAPPVVPEPKIPPVVNKISATSRDNRVSVSWYRPARARQASPRREIMEFEIYRKEMDAAAQEGGAGSAASLIAKVRADMPENARVRGDVYEYADEGEGNGLAYHRRYAYHVRSISFGGEASPPSKEVSIEITPSPAPPRFLKAIGDDGTVFLAWEASPFRTDGQELARPAHYNLYRGQTPQSFDPKPINPEPITETNYVDAGLKNDVGYFYVVRAVDTDLNPGAESLDSEEVAAVPMDATPPDRPRRLSGAPGEGQVRLVWEANPEPDLMGYFVYRSLFPDGGYVRLMGEPIPKVTYSDATVAPHTTYYYAISAVDASPRRNESGLSESLRMDMP